MGGNDTHGPRDSQALLTALTTEHFTLQSARSQTVSETSARSFLYMGSVSSALIALGFVSQISRGGQVFQLFALAVLPTIFLLGLITFGRMVQSSVEDVLYGRAINRIRHYYLELAGEDRTYFLLSAHDDPRGVLANMGLSGGSRWQLFFTIASAVSIINSIVGGGGIAILLGSTLTLHPVVAAVAGVLFAIASITFQKRYERRQHVEAASRVDSVFPSPS
jgi:hypothetical protein